MNRSKIIGISLIVLSVMLAIGVAIGGSYVYAKGIWNKKPVSEVKTINKQPVENPEMFSVYMQKMQTKIKANWNPPEQETSKRVTLLYAINKDGSLKSYEVKETSGVKELDDAAIDALKKSSPFEPLPEGFGGKYIDVQFTFDYNVHKKN